MERPFDYPGSVSDSIAPSPHDMKQLESFLVGDNDGMVSWKIVTVPNNWTDDDIDLIVADRWPAEHCTHAHDCCGNYYPRTAKWAKHPFMTECGLQTIIVSQNYICNV